ncbi:MAG TPA: branched-chain amino acid ABC transporter permease [Dehalococcoidales bacterium]
MLVVLALVPKLNNLYIIVLFITILSYVILTVSWALFSGPTGYVSLAPAAFFGLGMYTAAIFGKQIPFTEVIILAAALSFAFALLVGAVTLRLRGIYFTIFTFGLVFLIQQILTWWEITYTHTRGRFVVAVDNSIIYYHMLGILMILLITAFFLRRSKYGLALQSIGQNEDAAAHTGVNVTILKVVTFAISALFMGAAGAALAVRITYIDPGTAFNINYSFFPVLMAIFGGLSSLYGSIAGAAVFAYLEEQLTTRVPYYYMLIFGLIMVIVITFLPDGLVGLVQRWRKGGLAKTDAHT